MDDAYRGLTHYSTSAHETPSVSISGFTNVLTENNPLIDIVPTISIHDVELDLSKCIGKGFFGDGNNHQ